MKAKDLIYEEIIHHKANMVKELCHDINNKLQAVILPLELVQRECKSNQNTKLSEYTTNAFEKINEVSQIIDSFSMIHYPSISEDDFSLIPIQNVFNVINPIIERKCKKYDIKYNLKSYDTKVKGSYHEIAQVLYLLQKWGLNQIQNQKEERVFNLETFKNENQTIISLKISDIDRDKVSEIDRPEKQLDNSWFRLVKYLINKNRGDIEVEFREKVLTIKIKFMFYD